MSEETDQVTGQKNHTVRISFLLSSMHKLNTITITGHSYLEKNDSEVQ